MSIAHRHWATLVLLGTVVLLAVPSSLGATGTSERGGLAGAPVAPAPVPAAAPPSLGSAAVPHVAPQLPGASQSLQGPFEGRMYNVSTSTPLGLANTARVAVDSNTHLVYAVNRIAGDLAVFGESNQTLVALLQFTDNMFPTSVALDQDRQQLYVTFWSPSTVVMILNESTLTVEANISLASQVPSFYPLYSLYEPDSQQLFIETFNGSVAVVNTSTRSFSLAVWDPAPGGSAYGMIHDNTSTFDLVVVPAGTAMYAIQTSPLGFTGAILPPALGSFGAGTYDWQNSHLLVANGSQAQLYVYTSSGLYLSTQALGAGSITALTVDPVDDLVIFSAYSGGGARLWGLAGATLTNSSVSPPLPGRIDQLVLDNVTGRLVTGGLGNSSTVAVSLPSLATYAVYSSFPAERLQLVGDPVSGAYYVQEYSPFAIRAYSESTGAVLWSDGVSVLPNGTSGLGADPSLGRVYSLDFLGNRVNVLAASTGGLLSPIVLPPGSLPQGIVGFDSTRHVLYVPMSTGGGTYGVGSISTQSGTYTGNVSLGISPVCAVAADPAASSVWAITCYLGSYHALRVTEPSGAVTVNVSLPNYPVYPGGLAVSANGTAYVGGSGANITVVYPSGAEATIVPPGGLHPNALAVDDVDGLLFATVSSQWGLDPLVLYNTSTRTAVGTIPLPATVFATFFDPTTMTLVAPTAYSGQVTTVEQVPLPAAPTSPTVVAGNGTLRLQWTAPVMPASYPVTGELVAIANSSGGPWTETSIVPRTNWTFTDLALGSTYYLKVAAKGLGGTGAFSTPVSGVPVTLPYPPRNVVVTTNGSSALVVTWAAPASAGGSSVLNYTVQYGTAASGPWTSVNAGAATQHALSDLSASTTYYVRVVAWNAVGQGNPSAITTATTGSESPSGDLGVFGNTLFLGALIAAVVVVVAIAALVLLMRRRRPVPSSPSPPDAVPPGAQGTASPPPPEGSPPGG